MLNDILELFNKNNKLIDKHNENFEIETEELISHQAKYLCIITSGYLEQKLKEIGRFYKDNGGLSGCKRFLENIRNPKWCNILSYLVNIDINLISALDYKIKNKEEVKNHIELLANTRNDIAHGKNTNISISEMKSVIQSVHHLITCIDEIVKHQVSEIESSS